MAILCRLSAVTSHSPTVSAGSAAVGSCSSVIAAGGSLAGLGALVPSVRSLVADLGYAVVGFGSAVTILNGPVTILGCLVPLGGTVPIVAAGNLIPVHTGPEYARRVRHNPRPERNYPPRGAVSASGGLAGFVAVAFKPRAVAIYLSGVAGDIGVALVEGGPRFVSARRRGPLRPIMQPRLVVMRVGCLVEHDMQVGFVQTSLGDEAMGSDRSRQPRCVRGVIRGCEDDGDLRHGRHERAADAVAVIGTQADVEKHGIGRESCRGGQGGHRAIRLGDNLESARTQQIPDGAARAGMIVDEEDTKHGRTGCPARALPSIPQLRDLAGRVRPR